MTLQEAAEKYYLLKEQNDKLFSALKELYQFTPDIPEGNDEPFAKAIRNAFEAIKSCESSIKKESENQSI
jgi:hypothetical protein